MWDFETEPEYQAKLDWADAFVRAEVEPLDHIIDRPSNIRDPLFRQLVPPLQEKVKAKGLWATHLGPELGGPGDGQMHLALLNEILGRCKMGPMVFGCAAPDTGNAEILAHYGTPEQKERWLKPIMNDEFRTCYSMTEPHAGSDPGMFRTRAWRDGDGWMLEGYKWFSSYGDEAKLLIVMAVTNPEAPLTERASMFLVPRETPGIEIIRNVGQLGEAMGEGDHAYIHYNKVRLPPVSYTHLTLPTILRV